MKQPIGEKVAQFADLEYAEMRALLKTIIEDDHCLIHKLEVRLKQGGNYRCIVRVSRENEPANGRQ